MKRLFIPAFLLLFFCFSVAQVFAGITIQDSGSGGANLMLDGTTCLDTSGDRIFHDTNCNGTKDGGEEFVDAGASGDSITIDGVAATDPNLASDGDIDAIRCTGVGAPDASCSTAEDVIYRLQADSIDTITDIAAALKSGADGTVVTGTAGTNTLCGMWNADGDLVDSTLPCAATGADVTTVTGTAGTDGLCSKWNADGDLVDSTVPCTPTGADAATVTGTAGTNGNVAAWNTDGDIVDGGVSAADLASLLESATAFSLADATPDVSGGFVFKTADTTTFTDFDDGTDHTTFADSRLLIVYFQHAATLDCSSSQINCNGGADFVAIDGDVAECRFDDTTDADGQWVCNLSRTTNAATLTTGTIPAARVGADHIDTLTEIAAALKGGIGGKLTTQTGSFTSGNCTETDANGDLVDAGAPCGTTSPGGVNTQVQFNDASAFGGDAGMTYNKTTDTLTVGNISVPSGGSITVAANSTDGDSTTQCEDTDIGTDCVKVSVGQTDLPAGTTTHTWQSDATYPPAAIDTDIRRSSINVPFINDSGAITVGWEVQLEVPYSGTITAVRMGCEQSGSIVIDIWKDTYANYRPTDADSITASAVPTISGATKSQDTTLTGWTTSITAGDWLVFHVDSVTTVQNCTLSLTVLR